MDIDRFIAHLTEDINKDIAGDAETRFDTSIFESDIPFFKEKKK